MKIAQRFIARVAKRPKFHLRPRRTIELLMAPFRPSLRDLMVGDAFFTSSDKDQIARLELEIENRC